MIRRTAAAAVTLALLCSLAPVTLHAAQETGTITIEQQSPNGIYGEWILIKPGNKQTSLRRESYTFEEAALGNYTLRIEPPAGARTTVRVFVDQDLLKSHNQPQASFTLEQNMHIRLRIEYVFTRVGKIGVNSQPPGLDFTLRGPNDLEISDTTPASYEAMPEGQYTVTYQQIRDCPTTRPKSDKLLSEGRINFSIAFTCKGVENLQEEEYERTLQYVTTLIDGKSVTFQDVETDSWFAPYVSYALKTEIMSGYRDADGNPTGRYGPGDNVNMAQLAKIAHELADIDETAVRIRTRNLRAQDTWFEQYFASAESRGWLVFRDTRVDPNRPATRAEVVATLLQVLDVRRLWPRGTMFTDVNMSTTYASSIETATFDGVVSGYTNADGSATGRFGPDDPVNRAEMAKIIKTAFDTYRQDE